MKFKVEKPSDDNLEEQIMGIFELVYSQGNVKSPVSPRLFMQWWHEGYVKVFTCKDGGVYKAVRIYLVVADPVDSTKKHRIESIRVGENQEFDDFVKSALEVL